MLSIELFDVFKTIFGARGDQIVCQMSISYLLSSSVRTSEFVCRTSWSLVVVCCYVGLCRVFTRTEKKQKHIFVCVLTYFCVIQAFCVLAHFSIDAFLCSHSVGTFLVSVSVSVNVSLSISLFLSSLLNFNRFLGSSYLYE